MMSFKNRLTDSVNARLAFASSVMLLSQINFGMDTVAFSNTQAMKAFNKKYGAYNAKLERYALEPYFLSLLNSLPVVGQVFGVATGSYVTRHYGRRASFYVMCFWALVAATLLVTAEKKEQVLVGRIVNYIYLGQELVTVPMFQAEIAPPRVRGLVIGTFQLGTIIGSFIIAGISYRTSKIEGDASFRIPFGIFYIVPVLVAVGAWFMTESPRWLLIRERHEEALDSLRTYRQGKFSEKQILDEYHESAAMINALSHDKGTFREMWQGGGGVNRKRSLIVIGANVCIQISGQGLSSKYGTVFLADIHGPNPFQMNLITTGLSMAVVLLALALFDRIGRKPLLIIGSSVQAATYFAIGGLGTISHPGTGPKIGITALFTVNFLSFVFGWAPIYHIISSEVPSSRMRDITYAVASVFTVVTQFVVAFVIPYLLYPPYAALGSKVCFIFAPLAVGTLLFALFCVPECRNLSLEEIDELFRPRVPIREFSRHKRGEILPALVRDAAGLKLEEGPSVELREVVDP